ncbi:MAG: chaperone modulator CbpM [Planctomycetota bacterium]
MAEDEHGGKPQKNLVNLRELACLVGTSRRVIERLVWFEVIEPVRTEPEECFPVDILPRVTRILRIREHLGVSWSSMGLVLDLLERIEILESRRGND